MKNVITYSRSATSELIIDPRNGKHIEPLQYQNGLIMEFCNRYNYNVIEHFEEIYGCNKFNRPEWKKLKKLILDRFGNKEPIDSIIILRPDRFSRNLILSFSEIASLSKLGCEMEFVEGQVDYNNPEALLFQAIGFALPEIKKRKLSKRIKEGIHKSRLKGCFTGTAPRGYKCVLAGKDATLEFSQNADLIRESFEKISSGIYTADEVRLWLNGKGMKLSKNQFTNTIRNVTYSGKIVVKALGNQPEQIVQGLHSALVSEDLFAKANDELGSSKRNMDLNGVKINVSTH